MTIDIDDVLDRWHDRVDENNPTTCVKCKQPCEADSILCDDCLRHELVYLIERHMYQRFNTKVDVICYINDIGDARMLFRKFPNLLAFDGWALTDDRARLVHKFYRTE